MDSLTYTLAKTIHTDDGRGGPPAETVRSMETINKIKDSEMKVKDLINKLLKLNPELPVYGFIPDEEPYPIEVDDCLEDRVDINLVIDAWEPKIKKGQRKCI